MPDSKYYTKYSAREDFWAKVGARVVLSGITFFGTIMVELSFLMSSRGNTLHSGMAYFLEYLEKEGVSFVDFIFSWPMVTLPLVLSFIVLLIPSALKYGFGEAEEKGTLAEIREMSKERAPLRRAATSNGGGEFDDE